MNSLKRTLSALLFAAVISVPGISQQIKNIVYPISEVSRSATSSLGSPQIVAANSRVYQLNSDAILAQMQGVANREDLSGGFQAKINFPHPDGTFHEYTATANNTMHPELAAKFPEIGSFDATGENGEVVKWDVTPHGLHVMIMQPGQSTIYIDPLFAGNNEYYIVYRKKDFRTTKEFTCDFDSDVESLMPLEEPVSGTVKSFGSCQLRTYSLALSATGEYTTFHGGTVALAQAAQVTTMNRVNGVYERDMSVTMVIIPNNNLIIYTNSGSDPYTNGNPNSMITQNQTNTTSVIGSANYDIGHVFGTNSGGLAGLGVVCNNSQKARGVTGSAAPIGDAFDIDYVAHEMGHQFGCNHTFAGTVGSCSGNGNLATAMEPGSGSTIMAYAGICGSLNVQSNSDDNFHGISLQEMGTFVTGSGNSCATVTSLSNNPPVLVSTNGGVVIPQGTPFALTAVATDPDGNTLTYNWEQMNNAFTAATPSPTATSGPNFRSLPSSTSPTRYFPALPGTSTTWEMLPTVSRTLNFRVVVRDNAAGGGCNDHEDVTMTVDGGSGPFVVNYPSATGITWAGLSTQTVTWSVANTDVAPVACANVDILLSTDGGLTYPTVLASNVPNDGSQPVNVPNTATTTARVMVICSNGTFYDISNNNFTITAATNDYSLAVSPSSLTVCQPNNATFTVNIGSVGSFSNPVSLSVSGVPVGASSSFSVNPVTPVGQSILTISNTGAATPGVYTLTITANSTTGTKTSTVTLTISNGTPGTVTLTSPANGATAVSMPVNFTWTTVAGAGITYDIDIATDPGFASIADQATGLSTATYTSSALAAGTTYYWRVRSVTGCGSSAWSTAFTFSTNTCATYTSTDVPKAVGTASVTSVLNVAASGTITDLNVASLDITHTWVGDLRATLTSPAGTIVELFNGPGIPASTYGCDGDDILASFDDAAALTATDFENMCGASAPAITGNFQSNNPLANFNGEQMMGTWTLTVYDSYTGSDNGTLNAWSLEICSSPACVDATMPTVSGSTTVCPGANATLSISGGALNSASDWMWYTGSCGGSLVGTGTSVTVTPGASTTYYVRGEGGCTSPGICASVTVISQDATAPSITCPATQNMCGNSMPDFTALMTVVDNCDASPSISQSPAPGSAVSQGTVTVTMTVTDAAGNSSNCTFDLVVGSFMTNESVSICYGEVYTFPDGTSGSASQVHTSLLTSTGGCDSTVVTTLTVASQVNTGVAANGATLTANANGATYQWIDCDNGNALIAGATSQSYTPSAVTGNYAVIVSQGSCPDTSACYLVDYTGLDEIAGGSVVIYPNPTSGEVTIAWVGNVERIEVTDAQGKLVHVSPQTSGDSYQLSLARFSSGVYFVHVFSEQGRQVFDVLKQ